MLFSNWLEEGHEWWVVKYWKKAFIVYIKVLSGFSFGETERKYKISWDNY
jgi:hypothetical protein